MAAQSKKGTTAAKPKSQAMQAAEKRQQEAGTSALVLLAILAWSAVPPIFAAFPAQVAGFAWKEMIAPGAQFLWMELPPEGTPTFGIIPRAPIKQWVDWGLMLFGAFTCLTLLQHEMSLYAQRIRPLSAKRLYRLMRVPVSASLKPSDGLKLLKTLHGMLPSPNVHQGTAAPLVLRWTARPQQRIQQGLSIVDQGDLAISIGKVIEGVAGGTKVETKEDPFLAELKPGRWLCACDVQLTGPSDLPLAIGESDGNSVLESLLPTLAPQIGIVCADMQVILEPATDPSLKLRVKARLEQLKAELSQGERKALEAKADGPMFRCGVRLLVVGEQPDAGQTMLRTVSAAFAGTAQTTGTTEQRLRAGPVTVLPAVLPERPALPRIARRLAWIAGFILAGVLGFLLRHNAMLWPIAALSMFVPIMAVATYWRRKTKANMYDQHASLVKSVLPPRNPRCVPIWSAWLGRTEN